MSTHLAVVTAGLRAPLEIRKLPTVAPVESEVLVRVEWTASTPLDLHQNDGGLLVTHPQVLGGSLAGTVVEVGPNVCNLKKGDKVHRTPSKSVPIESVYSNIAGIWICMARTKREGSSGVRHSTRVSSWYGGSYFEL